MGRGNYSRRLPKNKRNAIGFPTPGQDVLPLQARKKIARAATIRAQDQLTKIFRGRKEVTLRTGIGNFRRKVDVWVSPNLALELKYGKDPVTTEEVWKDLSLRKKGGTLSESGKFVSSVEIEYHFVDNLTTGAHYAAADLDLLNFYGIPWHVWGPEFWEL